MKITLNWLKQYVDYNKSPEDLKEDLTMLGMEVERMEQISSGFDKIVVAQIEESKPLHPHLRSPARVQPLSTPPSPVIPRFFSHF